MLAGKGATATSHSRGINKKVWWIYRVGEGFVRFAYGNKNNKMGF